MSEVAPSVLRAYYRHQELLADDAVPNNIHLLRALKEYFKGTSGGKFHPHPKIRIKRLKRRIQALKEKGDPKAFEDPLAFKESQIK